MSRSVYDPDIEDEVRVALLNAAPDAVAFLHTVVNDETASVRARVDAAKTLLDRSGFPAAVPDSSDLAKLPSEMSHERLLAFVADIEAELANRACLVSEQSFLE